MNTPVSFPIAKLLKEKSFDIIDCSGYYHICDGYTKGYAHCYSDVNAQKEDAILAPTIAEIVMWLYEKHGIWISVYCDCYGILWYANLSVASEKNWDNIDLRHEIISASKKFPNEHNSPTEAYEAAIEYALKNLI